MSTSDSRTTSSSRLSQFGLYRTIDARTEEFLRLSRKRQIRQGCACAAVSTAITVTAVIIVFLVYEYNISPSANITRKFVRESTWLGLFNDSKLESQFNQANINIDPSMTKLLPLLLKTLNNNSYLSNILEDSDQGKEVQGKESTDYPYERNVFSHAKKWVKRPKPHSTKYKNHIMSPDEYGKARKLRKYQKMFNYFDTVIASATLNPIVKSIEEHKNNILKNNAHKTPNNIESPLKIKIDLPQIKINASSKIITMNSDCRCLQKVKDFLKKLLTDIQEFVAQIISERKICNDDEDVKKTTAIDISTEKYLKAPLNLPTTTDTISTTMIKKEHVIITPIVKSTTISAPVITTLKSYVTERQKLVNRPVTLKINKFKVKTIKKQLDKQVINGTDNIRDLLNAEKNPEEEVTTVTNKADSLKEALDIDLQEFIINDVYKSRYEKSSDRHNFEKLTRLYFHSHPSTTMKSSAVPTDTITQTSTEPIASYMNKVLNLKPLHTTMPQVVSTVKTTRLPDTFESSTRHSFDQSTLLLVNDYDENDSDTTLAPRTLIDDLEKLDIHAIELVKGKLLPNARLKQKTDPHENVDRPDERKNPRLEIVEQGTLATNSIKNIGEVENNTSSDIMKSFMKQNNNTQSVGNGLNDTITEKPKDSDKIAETVRQLLKPLTTIVNEDDQITNSNNSSATSNKPEEKRSSKSNFEEEFEIKTNNGGDIPYQEVSNEPVDELRKPMKQFNIYKMPTYSFAIGTGPDIDSLSESHPNSMLPENRPTYLEINRNDWKQDNHDYTTGDIVPYEFI